jgi:Phage integrase, N-terminal SAM-like domain
VDVAFQGAGVLGRTGEVDLGAGVRRQGVVEFAGELAQVPQAPGQPAAMSSRGSLQRKCVNGHPKAAGKCSGRCIRYYPRLELPHGRDGTRPFESLGGYPTRSQAEAALADALARRSHGIALDPAKLTVDQYLDRWLAHVRTSLRARTVARYAALLRDHVRPSLGARPLKQVTPLEVQAGL